MPVRVVFTALLRSWLQATELRIFSPKYYVSLTKITGVQAFEQSVIGNEPGDSTKAVSRMIELVKGDGMAAGKTVPLRVPLGTDGWTRIKAKCEDTLKICEEWEDLAKSTDVQQ